MNYDNDYLHRRWSFFVATRRRRVINVGKKTYLLDAQCVRAGLRNLMSKLTGPLNCVFAGQMKQHVPSQTFLFFFLSFPRSLRGRVSMRK